jgi:hypothetical protein
MTDDNPPPPDDEELEPAPADRPTVDSGTRKGRDTQARRIKREAKEAGEFWLRLLNDPIGRRELWRIACGSDGAHAFETRFAAGPSGIPDEYATWHAKGEQDFGLRLYHKWLLLDPLAVAAMHNENDSRFASKRPKGE